MGEAFQSEVSGYPLWLPAESQLPGILASLPAYGTNVARLAQTVMMKYPDLTIVDIGANVGDTVAMLRSAVRCPILCVEGCAEYLKLLHENLRLFSEAEVEECLVGGIGPGIGAQFIVEKGTGYLSPAADNSPANTLSMEEVLSRHPRFAASKLWKIDTDGWDSYILQENWRVVERVRPVIFFEYDPHFFVGPLQRGAAVFETLERAGYHDVLFWENNGDFLLQTDLTRHGELEDLHEAVVGRGKTRYWDIAAFPKEDGPLARAQRASEIAYFRMMRRNAR